MFCEAAAHVDDLGLDKDDPRLALTLDLTRQLIGTPRHLSQHPGGFVLTHDRLDDLVPIEPAAMEDRRVIEWEKDDLEELRIMVMSPARPSLWQLRVTFSLPLRA